MALIETHLAKFNFTAADNAHIAEIGYYIDLKKGDCFSTFGKIPDRMGFLLEGILYSYTFDEEGNKKVSQLFSPEHNYIVVDYGNYTQDLKSTVNIEALEPARLFVLEKAHINQLYIDNPIYIQVQRELARQLYIDSLQLINLFQTCNAVERLKILQRIAPEFFKHVPYSYLASFLGMHRNTFNAAMKKL